MERREAIKQTLVIAGYTVSASAWAQLLAGCGTREATWAPRTLSHNDVSLLSEIGERILPKTDTPGSKDLLLERFIDSFVTEVFSNDEKTAFVEGLKDLDKTCEEFSGKTLSRSSAVEQIKFLTTLEASADPNAQPEAWGMKLRQTGKVDFFRRLKGLFLTGYFTSEEVGKNLLHYNPIPGVYEACLPVTADTRLQFE